MKTKMYLPAIVFSAMLCGLLTGCNNKKDDNPEPQPEPPVLVWDGVTVTQPAGFTDTPGTVSITSAPELAWISHASQGEEGLGFDGYSFVLTADIDLNNKEWVPVGTGYYSSALRFNADFDGGGHTISNLKISGTENDYAGLFGYVTGTIKDLHIASGSVSGHDYVGAICGYAGKSASTAAITGCTNAAAVSGRTNVGGVAGSLAGGATLTGCGNSGTISAAHGTYGDSYAGGICGYAPNGTVTRCTNSGSVTGTGHDVGGICGGAGYFGYYPATISACLNTGTVTGMAYTGGICGATEHADCRIVACRNSGTVNGGGAEQLSGSGGVCGYMKGQMIACYNTGALNLGNESGGVVGQLQPDSHITACYNTATVNASRGFPGGIAGVSNYGTVTACYHKPGGDVPGVGTDLYGVTDTREFSATAWPATGSSRGQSAEWGTGDGSASGKYWKSLGAWNGGNPAYPTLYWE